MDSFVYSLIIVYYGLEPPSLIPIKKKKPYFKVCDEDYTCENAPLWDLAKEDDWSYTSESERKLVEENIKKEEEKKEKEWW